ncbi:MAG: DUF167 family protein [Actinomycetota bacterium]
MRSSSSGKLTFGSTGSNGIRSASSHALRRRERLVPSGDEARAPRYHPACRALAGAAAHRPPSRPPAFTGGSRLRLPRRRAPVRAGARGGWSCGARHRAHTIPGSLPLRRTHDRVPVAACGAHATPTMGRITVRVVPRSARTGVDGGPEGPLIRVRAAPEGGRATAEAARALAAALGVPPSAVRLIRGGRSRIKTFAVEGLSDEALREAVSGS